MAKPQNDSLLYREYDSIFVRFQYSNTDSLEYFMKRGLGQFTIDKYKPGIARMLVHLGGIYSDEGLAEVGKKAEDEALNIYTELQDKSGIAKANDLLGIYEARKSNFEAAVAHFIIALKIYDELNDTVGIVDNYIKLGTANEKNGNLNKGLEYYNKGLALYQGKPIRDIDIFLNVNLGAIYSSKKDIKTALKYWEVALKESKSDSFKQIRILPLENLGDAYIQLGDRATALGFLNEALGIAEQEHLSESQVIILTNIASIYKGTNLQKSQALLSEALQISVHTGQRSMQADVLKSMAEIYEAMGDYKQAYVLQLRQQELSDSLFNIEKERAVANLEALYDVDKLSSKVQKLELLAEQRREKEHVATIIAFFVTLLLIIVFVFFGKTNYLNRELNVREAKLQKASMVKNKLISIIAHDLMGSIGFMPTALELSKHKSLSAEERDKLLAQVEMSAVTSYETLQNMLDWGKAQIQGNVLSQADFNVNEMSKEVIQFTNIAATNKQIAVVYDIDPALSIFADPNHFKFILRNLLANAIKYTGKNGTIQITAEKTSDQSFVVFSIKDNGVGISADRIPTVFDTTDNSVAGTNNEKGNGIGLQLCREFATANGGKIWVESKVDEGCLFCFTMRATA